jgi:hypothetical protein
MGPPHAFTLLTDWLGLRPALSRTWWTALAKTPWADAVALHSATLLADAVPRAMLPTHLIHQVWAPKQLIDGLEACVAVGTLSRRDATRIEEHILRYTTAEGRWG